MARSLEMIKARKHTVIYTVIKLDEYFFINITWVMLQNNVVETAGCSCVAGPGRSCSHAAAVLWKVGIYK